MCLIRFQIKFEKVYACPEKRFIAVIHYANNLSRYLHDVWIICNAEWRQTDVEFDEFLILQAMAKENICPIQGNIFNEAVIGILPINEGRCMPSDVNARLSTAFCMFPGILRCWLGYLGSRLR